MKKSVYVVVFVTSTTKFFSNLCYEYPPKKSCICVWFFGYQNQSFVHPTHEKKCKHHISTIIKIQDVFADTLVSHSYLSRFLSSFAFENIYLCLSLFLSSFAFGNKKTSYKKSL